MGAETPNPNPSEGEKLSPRAELLKDASERMQSLDALAGEIRWKGASLENRSRVHSAARLIGRLAAAFAAADSALSAKDARIVELEAALEPFARHAEALEGCGDAVEVWLYCTEHDMWLAGDAPIASDFRRALAASKEVE